MGKIRILSEDVFNRIAAGEVVERPASIVKELVENALDAEASAIWVHIRAGGRIGIQVRDNGVGMDPEDALLCLEAHATSKIKTIEEIDRLHYMGFRGEALPSIVSVTRFILQTRVRDAEMGTEVKVDGGMIKETRLIACPYGSSISANRVFYNTPVRRKFLCSIHTEEAHIEAIVLQLALANPKVAFELTFDDRPILSLQVMQDPYIRAAYLFGKHRVDAEMLKVDRQVDGCRIHGLIARPGLTRSNRREQRVFINNRPVHSETIAFAIREAYHGLVMKGRYPLVLLFIELDPNQVDVNVHPAKREVRFRQRKRIGAFISDALRHTLQTATDHAYNAVPKEAEYRLPHAQTGIINLPERAHPSTSKEMNTLETRSLRGHSLSAAYRDEICSLRIIGYLHNLYILTEGTTGLLLIDQHAAHERILFEKIYKNKDKNSCQGLLIPLTFECPAQDAVLLRKYQATLNQLGFLFEDFGEDSFIIHTIPSQFKPESIEGILREMIDYLHHAASLKPGRADETLIAKAACKAAVKAYDPLCLPEIKQLLQDLAQAELPYTCPHGRPTMITISTQELATRFGRKQ